MERQPPAGPGGGEPFPSFDPDFTPPQPARGQAPQGESPRPQPRRPAAPSRSGGRPPGRGGDQPTPWIVGMAVAAVLAAVSIITFGIFGGSSEGTSSGTTVATTIPTETTVPGEATTTLPDDGSSTTAPGQTTIPGNGGTGTITPIGDPIPLSEMQMKAAGIGPLNFGDSSDQVLGRLAATYGQPTDDTAFFVGDGTFGECPGDSVRVVRWGPLNIVSVGEEGSAEFVSFRLDLRYGGISSPTTDIATLSGLRVGDQVADLESIYGGFLIEYVVDQDVGLTFELRENQGGDLLLWGPVDSQAEDALVTGIYSKDYCETPEPDPPDG